MPIALLPVRDGSDHRQRLISKIVKILLQLVKETENPPRRTRKLVGGHKISWVDVLRPLDP